MRLDEFGPRLARAVLFTGLGAFGLAQFLGIQSGAPWFSIVVGLCIMTGVLASQATMLSLLTFAAGLALWTGLLPRDISVADITGRARAMIEQQAPVAAPASAPDSRSAPLAERLEQLGLACQKNLLSPEECKATRESILEKFKTAR